MRVLMSCFGSRLILPALSMMLFAPPPRALPATDEATPTITVTPSALAAELSPFESTTRTLTIGNEGESDLVWSLALTPAAARRQYTFAPLQAAADLPPGLPTAALPTSPSSALTGDLLDLTGLRILWDVSHGQPPPDFAGLLIADLRQRGATVDEHAGPVTAEALAGCRVFWSQEMAWTWSAAELADVATWARRGGGLLLEGRDGSGAFTALLAALGAGVEGGGPDIDSVLYVRPGHELTEAVPLLLTGLGQAGLARVVPPALVLANDGAGTPATACSSAGGGRIVVSGAPLFGDARVTFPYNRRFGHNVIDWLAGAQWLEAQPREGTVPPGGYGEVAVTISAGGSCETGRQAWAVISSNDPASPNVEVPVRLDVVPSPGLRTQATVDLADAYVGTGTTTTVDIVNAGCADLHVTGISIDGAGFGVVPSAALTLAPDATASLTVSFTPTRAGAAAGRLRLASDDPAMPVTIVELEGTGVAPPEIGVAPSTVTVELPSRARATRTVDITNRGKSDLAWTARVASGASGPSASPRDLPTAATPQSGLPSDLLGVRILWDLAHGQADTAAVRDLASELAARGAELSQSSRPWTPELLAGCDVIWTSTPSLYWAATEVAAARAWLHAGGSLLLTSSSSGAVCNSLLSSTAPGIAFAYAARDAGVTTDLDEHETTVGISALSLPGANARLSVADGSTVALARGPAGVVVAAATERAGGRIVVMSDQLFHDAPLAEQDNRRFAHQVFTWLGGFGWMQVDPRAGSVAPGATTTVKLTMNPQGRCGPQAPARLVLASNDPATPATAVAVDLTVAGSPDAAVSTDGLSFGAGYLGLARVDSFTIANPGCVDLHVEPSLDDSQFACRPSSAFVVPPHGETVVTVTYAPSWPRPVSATLALATDDPDEPVATVALRGLGIAPPVMAIAPDSFTVELAPGARATRTLTIANTGWDDLRWNLGSVPELRTGPYGQGTGPRILLLLYGSNSNSVVAAALARRGLSYTMATSWNTFNTLLRTAPGWDLVAVESGGAGAFETGLDALADYVEAGGRLLHIDNLIAFYAQHRLAGLMGVEISGRSRLSFAVEAALPGEALFRVPHRVGSLRSTATPAYGNGMSVTPRPGATVLATFAGTPGEAAIVRGPRGNTLFHAFEPQYCGADDDGDGVRDAIELIENELFALGVGAPWVSASPTSGLVPRGGTVEVTVTWDAAGLCGGSFTAGLYVLSNDPRHDAVRIPLELAVGEAPSAAVRPGALAFGDCQVGATGTAGFAVVNRGCRPLTVTGVTSTPGPFAVAGDPAFAVAAGDSELVEVAFSPVAPGPVSATVTIATDDPTHRLLTLPLTGTGRLPPVMEVATDTLAAVLPPGGTVTLELAVANRGAADLHWLAATEPRFPVQVIARSPVFAGPAAAMAPGPAGDSTGKVADQGVPSPAAPPGALHTSPPSGVAGAVTAVAAAPDLEAVLARLDAGATAVTAAIPDRYAFTEGVAGNYIIDGGRDMFDGGNAIYTDRGGPLPYSDGRISGHAAFGDRGRYVTRKLPGLFVLAADLGGIATFGTVGNLGADGAGQVDGVVLEMALADGRRYLGLAKRVWGAGDPSVNHLVIVEAADGITQSFPPSTDSDYHEIAGLAGRTRLYYLLFAASEGGWVDDQALARIMEAFLGLLGEGTRWLAVTPVSGTLAPGATTELAVTIAASDMPPGDHLAALTLRGDDPLSPSIEVPARLRVVPGTAWPAAVTGGGADLGLGNDPNPFNPRTEVRFALAHPGEVEVLIYDARGLLVRRLPVGRLPAGTAGVVWDGRTAAGTEAGSGVYLYRVLRDGRPFGEAGKMTLVR